ncbi:MAG: restriction endonuclease subunit S [Kiritimatiellae bacterium]|nr:restriction endonuclease subunit S [Kiritimatiellia bacterium]
MNDAVTYPAEWEVVPLKSLGEIKSGGTPSRNVPAYWNGTIPWVTPTELTGMSEKYLRETQERITPAGLAASAASLLPAGSLLVTTRATIGSIAIAGLPVTTNQGFKNIVPNAKSDSGFFYYCLQTLVPEMYRRAIGSTFQEISKKEFERISAPRPQKPEQTAIAGILDTVDEAIQQTAAVIEKLKKIKAGLLHDLLTRGIDEDGQIRANTPSNNNFQISQLAYINPNVDTSRLHPQTPVSFVPMEDVSEGGHWVHRQTQQMQHVSTGYTAFQEGDILFAKITPCMENGKGIHAIGTINGFGFASTEFHVLRAKGKNSARFVFWQTMNPALRLLAAARMTGSAGQQRVPSSFFDHFAVPYFDPDEQGRIADRLDLMEARLQAESATLCKLTLIKQGLMQDLLTGRVRVPVKTNGKARIQ